MLLLCLPTPLTLVCGGESDHPAFWSIRQHISPSGQQLHHSSEVCPQIRGDSVVRMWVQLKRCVSCVLQRGHNGDGCDLASTLCKYDLRKGDLYVLSSELLKCGGGVRSILL